MASGEEPSKGSSYQHGYPFPGELESYAQYNDDDQYWDKSKIWEYVIYLSHLHSSYGTNVITASIIVPSVSAAWNAATVE